MIIRNSVHMCWRCMVVSLCICQAVYLLSVTWISWKSLKTSTCWMQYSHSMTISRTYVYNCIVQLLTVEVLWACGSEPICRDCPKTRSQLNVLAFSRRYHRSTCYTRLCYTRLHYVHCYYGYYGFVSCVTVSLYLSVLMYLQSVLSSLVLCLK